MAECEVQCCEMAEVEVQAVELWEDNHSRFETLFQEKRTYYKPNSTFFKIVSKIRGTFIIIINYFNTFPEFSTSPEALNLTFNGNDELERLLREYTDDESYFTGLLKCLKTIASEVHTACFVTHNSDYKITKKSASQANKNTKEQISNIPTKKQKTSSSVNPLKKEVVVSSVETKNKYEVLSGLPSAEEVVTSYQPVPSVPTMSVMETNETPEITVTERTVKKKEPRPPPITVLGHDNICQNNKVIKSILKGDLKVVNTREGLKYHVTSVEDHRILTEHLKSQNKQYYTYQLRSDLPLRVMIKRLPISADQEEIKQELSLLGFPVRSVRQLTKKVDDRVIKMPIYLTELDNNDKAKEIYNLKRLFYTVISVESYRPRSGLKQCFRCQRFNHTWAGCSLTPRCLLCAKNHNHKDCPIRTEASEDKSKLKCANCEETGHPASSHDCEIYKKALEDFLKPKNTQQNKKSNATTLGRSFTSKRTTQGRSYSSAVVNETTESQIAFTPAQSRLKEVLTQRRSFPTGVSNSSVEQIAKEISPMLSGLGSPLEKFMLLSQLVDLCFGNV